VSIKPEEEAHERGTEAGSSARTLANPPFATTSVPSKELSPSS
jgi:hypothetical protein